MEDEPIIRLPRPKTTVKHAGTPAEEDSMETFVSIWDTAEAWWHAHPDSHGWILLTLAALVWLLFARMVGEQARAKGYSFAKFYLLALVVSPFALSAALHMMPPRREPQGSERPGR